MCNWLAIASISFSASRKSFSKLRMAFTPFFRRRKNLKTYREWDKMEMKFLIGRR
ncbi:hypothetical protein BSNK01_15220 [Bacillaceae bacterium]